MIYVKKDNSILWLFSFKLLLDVVFRVLMAETYQYYGYVYSDNLFKISMAWLIFIFFIPSIVNCKNGKSLGKSIVFFLSLLYFIPGLSIFQFIEVDRVMYSYWVLFWCTLFMAVGYDSHFKIKLKRINGTELLCILGIAFICGLIFFMFVKYARFRLMVTFTREYVLRDQERAIHLPRIISYLYAMSQVLITIAICYVIKTRNIILLAFLLFIQLCNFSIGGHKSILIITLACAGIQLLFELFDRDVAQKYVLILMNFELVLELLTGKLFNNLQLMANISRRVYFLPQLINTYYYDYSSKYGFDYYSQQLGKFFGSSGGVKIQSSISKIYMGVDGNANNGLFSEAYSNLGILGCVLLPIIIVFVSDCLGFLLDDEDESMITIFGFICAFIWGSGNVSTGLITNGLLLAAILVFFSNKKKNYLRQIKWSRRDFFVK